MSTALKVLLIEDTKADADLVIRALERGGYKVDFERVATEEGVRAALNKNSWQLVLSDYSLPGFSGLKALSILKSGAFDIPFILVSGTVGEAMAVEAIKAGADDYIMKDNLTRLIPTIQRELKEAETRKANKLVSKALERSEENLRQAQKLDVVGRLAGGIAHDFNNIIAIILMQVDITQESLQKSLPIEKLIENVEKGLEQIKKSGLRASNLTRQLLAFSRKQVIQTRVLNLNSLVSDLETMLRRVLEENIDLKTQLGTSLKNIKVDPGHVEQILLNLVVNSRDAMPKGGTLEIKTENSEVDAEIAKSCNVKPGPHVLLTVTDSGEGMKLEVQKKIFDPFFTTKEIGKGTGLGLSIVYGIVKQNNGLIFAQSKPGKGATFKIYFPITDETISEVKSEENVLKPHGGKETILVVEDEKELRDIINETLTSKGYNVITAINGIEALEIIKKTDHPIDLMLTDVVMPLMGGVDLAKQVHLLDNCKKTKILFQSGYTEDALLRSGLESKDIHFLEKPYALTRLLNKIRTVLN